MSARILLGAYALAVLASGFVHDPWVLAGATFVTLALCGRRAGRILRRVAVAVGLFVATVVGAYAVFSWWRTGTIDGAWSLRIVLRAVWLTSMTLLVVDRVDFARALAPWPGAIMMVTMVGAQIRLLQRQLEDFRLGLRSRSPRRATTFTAARHAAAGGAQLLGRALHDADEIALALRARGAWHDRG